MKRLIYLAVFLQISLTSAAQGVKMGIKGGLNLAKFDLADSGISASSSNLTSFHGGIYVTIMTSAKFGIQPEILYSGQGGTSGGDLTLGYLNFPVMLRYNLAPMVSLQAGPQLGILLSASDGTNDIKSQFASTDFGAAFGLAVELPSGVNLSFRYATGFTNILNVDFAALGLSVSPTMTNRVIQFSIGFKLSGT